MPVKFVLCQPTEIYCFVDSAYDKLLKRSMGLQPKTDGWRIKRLKTR